MKKLFYLLIALVASGPVPAQHKQPRIAIAGIGIESSTFSPALSTEASFLIKRGSEIYTSYPGFMQEGSAARQAALWFPAVTARSLPGGAVTREAYETMAGYILDSLKKNLPYDGLFFDIHGAMSVVGLDDPEGDLITRVRKVTGNKTVISTSMDLHGNVSMRLAENSDLITCYRMAPHEDAQETKQRSVEQLLERLISGKGKPRYKAWIPVPVLLPGEQTSTRIEPAKSLYAAVAPASARPGVVEAAIWVGYPWADEPRNHAVIMVTGDDRSAVAASAEELAKHFWRVRHQFDFVAPTGTLKECLDKALASKKRPFFISDSGDNPTAGGAGDVTWSLQQILARKEFKSPGGPTVIYASIPGPELIKKALAAGVGATIKAPVGAAVDNRYAPPIVLEGIIRSIEKGDRNAEVEVVVQVGSVHVIVTQKRKPYHKEADFTRLGLQPRQADIVIVKIGYLEPELYNMRTDWLLALTPGGVDQELARLPYKRIQRPMFPVDKNTPDPDLSVRWVKASDEVVLP
ncbi:MAG: M81 family metallopeptidase [Chitinophagaceae bacterium]|nr:M81 family metallopeptidase [Chitinophagaceae bacterium]MCW5928671.1 M81 family metallopeptidase [Chitinophagaceae bacterium]